ncbi:MBL fold metallo-hydrolase [Thauera mechernichensis]
MLDLISHADGVHAVDSGYGRPQLAAIHIIVQDGRAAIVDTGSNASVPRVLGALAALGIAPEAVDWVLFTHIHLDHAGGAGSLMCALPHARLVVHPRGVRHMTDPSRLWDATCAVYGPERAFALYGRLVPVAAERIVPATDGLELKLGGRCLRIFDTPGHARHHVCIWDDSARAFFTGNTLACPIASLMSMAVPSSCRRRRRPSSSPRRCTPPSTACWRCSRRPCT